MVTGAEPLPIRSFVAVVLPGDGRMTGEPHFAEPGWQSFHDGRVHVWFLARQVYPAERVPSWPLLLGDPAEWDPQVRARNLANGVPIEYDARSRALTLHTSIVALPPVFVHRNAALTALASDLYLLPSLPGVTLELDPTSVKQLGEIGHPVGHRTLFQNTELLPGGSRVVLDEQGLHVERSWQLAEAAPLPWDQFIEKQVAAFTSAVHRLNVSRSVLSLTAGLDTRTVFAALAAEGRLVPAVTMSGVQPSLDARTASALCRAYGVPHEVVAFDERFTKELPVLVEEASRLSGGLESLEQAPEVFMYRHLGGRFGARLSGNLGNQVGRGGTEGVGVRGAALDVLAPDFVAEAKKARQGHWLLEHLEGGHSSALAFILQHEIPFSSVANFSVGSHFAIQQSPYADRTLVDSLALKPHSNGHAPSSSLLRMRLRDLNHRFLGEPANVSFQRSLLKRTGGIAARYPINYGWRAVGGVSPLGLVRGGATLLGMIAQKARLDDGPLGGLVARTGLPALHNFRHSSRWLRRHLREFSYDVLDSEHVRTAGAFDSTRLRAALDDHFAGRADRHETVGFALDVALAHRVVARHG